MRLVTLIRIFLPAALTAPWAALVPAARPAWYARLVRALERCGATFIKLGQIASTRPDLVPPDLCRALGKLHDDAPAHSYEACRATVEAAFGKPLEELFAEFEPAPIASGSIAQVHRAALADGTPVAVKVRHPGAARVIETDLKIIAGGAKLLDKLPSMHWLALPESAAQFSETMHNQLDLVREARNLERFAANFADQPRVHFPTPVAGLVHEAVLVESFEPGVSITRYVDSEDPRRPDLARLGLSTILEMIFRHGFVHADLHPGNILVRENDGGDLEVVLLDVGMVAELSDRDRGNFTAFFGTLAGGDGRAAAQLMIDHAPHHACPDEAAFTAEIDAIFTQVRESNIAEIEVAAILSRVMDAVRRHRIKIESAFTSVNVGIMVLEGLGRRLDPDLNLLEFGTPLLMAIQLEGAGETTA